MAETKLTYMISLGSERLTPFYGESQREHDATAYPPNIPPEHIYCIQAGKKHYNLFTTIYVGANYCGCCGLANPFRSQLLPGLYNEVVEVEDSPLRPVSPVSRLLHDKLKPVSSIDIRRAQLLPNKVSALSAVNIQACIPPSEASSNPQFITNSKSSTRKPANLLLVSLETRYFNGLSVEVPETVLLLKDIVIKFSSADLLTWPSFTETLFDHLRPLPSAIDPANKDLWSLSYASTFSSKKIVTVPNTDKYMTPSGQLKVLVVLISTDVVDKQDEYSMSVKEEKKRKCVKGTVERDQIKQEEPSLICDELRDIAKEVARYGDVVDLSELEDLLSDLGDEGVVDEEDKVNEEDFEEEISFILEFVNLELIPQTLPPAHSIRFKGTKIPITFASRYRKRKD
ncbi:hypothetical protein BKA56DRAFT_708191 [Ilyonectria sp. MPI-CAGE-AT-0026]|nr:hypothetical protein BKA56DRAFT_708191 [Ilyonectria sp. MPI-CAGE-AT-0026]